MERRIFPLQDDLRESVCAFGRSLYVSVRYSSRSATLHMNLILAQADLFL